MRRPALGLRKAQRRQVSMPVSMPAPTKGWMTADNLADMKPGSAVLLDNWFPETDSVRPRRGSAVYASGLGARPVEAMFSFVDGSNERFFSACGSNIFDITPDPVTGVVTPVAIPISGFSSARWQAVRFTGSGGPQLLLYNGIDFPLRFDGTSWSLLAYTLEGDLFDFRALIGGYTYAQRLFLIAKGSATVFYAPVDSFQGDLGQLQVGAELTEGGSIVALGRWSSDAGDGPQDTLVAISDHGEMVAYQGTNPSSPTAWGLVGKYDTAPAIGYRCTARLGGDLGIVTRDGLQSVLQAVTKDRAEAGKGGAFTANIRSAWKADTETYGDLFGWQAFMFRERAMLIINVPLSESGLARQYVMNVQTGAWTRFNSLQAVCWASFAGKLYFGAANGTVVQADVGYGDQGRPTIYPLIGAFTAIKNRGQTKHAKLMRPVLMTNVPVTLKIGVAVDFILGLPNGGVNEQDVGAARWDAARWNTSRWASSLFGAPQQSWSSAIGEGNAFAPAALLVLDGTTPSAADIRLTAFDLLLEGGGVL